MGLPKSKHLYTGILNGWLNPQKGWKTRGIRFKAENSLQLVIVDENNNKMLIQQIQVVISAIREYFSH
jgi:hypothetical protein